MSLKWTTPITLLLCGLCLVIIVLNGAMLRMMCSYTQRGSYACHYLGLCDQTGLCMTVQRLDDIFSWIDEQIRQLLRSIFEADSAFEKTQKNLACMVAHTNAGAKAEQGTTFSALLPSLQQNETAVDMNRDMLRGLQQHIERIVPQGVATFREISDTVRELAESSSEAAKAHEELRSCQSQELSCDIIAQFHAEKAASLAQEITTFQQGIPRLLGDIISDLLQLKADLRNLGDGTREIHTSLDYLVRHVTDSIELIDKYEVRPLDARLGNAFVYGGGVSCLALGVGAAAFSGGIGALVVAPVCWAGEAALIAHLNDQRQTAAYQVQNAAIVLHNRIPSLSALAEQFQSASDFLYEAAIDVTHLRGDILNFQERASDASYRLIELAEKSEKIMTKFQDLDRDIAGHDFGQFSRVEGVRLLDGCPGY